MRVSRVYYKIALLKKAMAPYLIVERVLLGFVLGGGPGVLDEGVALVEGLLTVLVAWADLAI